MPKIIDLSNFWKTEACGQTVLPDNSVYDMTKMGKRCQNISMRQFVGFSTNMDPYIF